MEYDQDGDISSIQSDTGEILPATYFPESLQLGILDNHVVQDPSEQERQIRARVWILLPC